MRKYIVVAVLVLAVALAGVYYFFDPAEVGWMPRCLWKLLTGTDCPGCGSQRMAHALLHGDLVTAWHANAYALCMIPVILFLIWLEFRRERHQRLYMKVHAPVVIVAFSASLLAWWVLRNVV